MRERTRKGRVRVRRGVEEEAEKTVKVVAGAVRETSEMVKTEEVGWTEMWSTACSEEAQ